MHRSDRAGTAAVLWTSVTPPVVPLAALAKLSDREHTNSLLIVEGLPQEATPPTTPAPTVLPTPTPTGELRAFLCVHAPRKRAARFPRTGAYTERQGQSHIGYVLRCVHGVSEVKGRSFLNMGPLPSGGGIEKLNKLCLSETSGC